MNTILSKFLVFALLATLGMTMMICSVEARRILTFNSPVLDPNTQAPPTPSSNYCKGYSNIIPWCWNKRA
ncbi:hypothetical protein CsatB_005381 [Cannabis sativa]